MSLNPLFDAQKFDEKAPYLVIPVLAHYKFYPSIAVGLGMYFGFGAGNITDSGSINSSQSFSSANYSSSDYGLAADAQYAYQFDPNWSAVVDLTYLYGLSNVSTASGTTLNNYSILGLIGVGYNF